MKNPAWAIKKQRAERGQWSAYNFSLCISPMILVYHLRMIFSGYQSIDRGWDGYLHATTNSWYLTKYTFVTISECLLWITFSSFQNIDRIGFPCRRSEGLITRSLLTRPPYNHGEGTCDKALRTSAFYIDFMDQRRFLGTYPSPKSTLTLTSHSEQNCDLGEG